jgi:outer membrane biosynthesis protein TonB
VNSKILMAFATGAVIASGIVYMAVRPEETPRPAPIVVQPKPAASPVLTAQADSPPAQPAVVPEHVPAPVAQPVPTQRPAYTPVREKPSPVRPPARHERPVIIARNENPPPQEPAPSPMPAPQPPPPAPVQDAPPPPTVTAPPVVVTTPQPPAPQEEQAPPPQVPETRTPNTVTIRPGTVLTVRIAETLSAARNEKGDGFLATLEQPLVIDGFIIAERGARVEGQVVEAQQPGRAGGPSHLGVELVRLSTSDGQRVRIRTEPFKKDGASSAGSDLAKIGVGAAIGAAIGAAAGGGKGAAIGAGVGGAAGTADVLLTRGKPAEIPVETRITFRVQEPITLTERLQ